MAADSAWESEASLGLCHCQASLSSAQPRPDISADPRTAAPMFALWQSGWTAQHYLLFSSHCTVVSPSDLLFIQEAVLAEPLVVSLNVHHGDLQLFVDFHPTLVHLPEGCGLLG